MILIESLKFKGPLSRRLQEQMRNMLIVTELYLNVDTGVVYSAGAFGIELGIKDWRGPDSDTRRLFIDVGYLINH
jgi:hypothetical protein